jgi:multiple sugar transport system permease protein
MRATISAPLGKSADPPARTDWRGKKLTGRFRKAIAYLVLTGGGAIMFVPFLWMLSSSLKDAASVFIYPPQWIPDPVRWSNYQYVLTQLPMLKYFQNTMIIVTGSLIGQVLTAGMSGYAFSRLRWPGRDLIFGVILATMMLPYVVTMIPVFILFKELHWLNTFLPLIVPAWFGGGGYSIFLLRQFFLTLPMELDDAARIDGASSWGIFWRVIVPLSLPALAVVALLSFLSHWNDFMGPLIYLTDQNKRTLALGLNALQGLEWGRDMTEILMAASTLVIIPPMALFFLFQRVFIQGVALTGIKG